jgi:hypothetical protein
MDVQEENHHISATILKEDGKLIKLAEPPKLRDSSKKKLLAKLEKKEGNGLHRGLRIPGVLL